MESEDSKPAGIPSTNSHYYKPSTACNRRSKNSNIRTMPATLGGSLSLVTQDAHALEDNKCMLMQHSPKLGILTTCQSEEVIE